MDAMKQWLIGYRMVVFLGEDVGGEGVRQAEIPATLGNDHPHAFTIDVQDGSELSRRNTLKTETAPRHGIYHLSMQSVVSRCLIHICLHELYSASTVLELLLLPRAS
jgi:hypothetical protein